ncbi:MAG: hypothetical protein R3292_10900, partial [Alcanivorax sp.]|nr:hypothetical protein [Alcanivorax sp.]
KVSWGDNAVFTLTPNAHMAAKANSNCGGIANFSNSGTTFTVYNVTADCTVTFSFQSIMHDVTAKVVDGMFVPAAPTEVAGQADFVALDTANKALYAVDENGDSGSIQASTYDASGALTAYASALSAPMAASCDGSSGNSAPGHCLQVGENGNATDRVYAILNQNNGSVIRVYQASSGDLTKVADVDPAANLVDGNSQAISILEVNAIALDGAHNRLFAAVRTKDINGQEDTGVLSYDIAADGTFNVNQGVLLGNSGARQLNGLVANAAGSDLYVSFDEPSQSSAVSDKAGVLHFTVDTSTGQISSTWAASILSQDGIKTQDLALTPDSKKAYYIYAFDNAPFGTPVAVKGYSLDGNGDLSSPVNLLSYSDTQRVAMTIADNGKVAYLRAETSSTSSTANNIAIYAIDSSTPKLSLKATATTLASNNTHSMAIDYSNGLAYVADPAGNTISQYRVGTDKGSVSPSSQQVDDGGTATVTLTATDPSYLAAASGCGGTLSANTYSASNITASCQVIGTFVKP